MYMSDDLSSFFIYELVLKYVIIIFRLKMFIFYFIIIGCVYELIE